MSNCKTTILGYCDDHILMASSLAHMQKLLDKCQNFSEKWNIKLNANKSVVINAGFKMYIANLNAHMVWVFLIYIKNNQVDKCISK